MKFFLNKLDLNEQSLILYDVSKLISEFPLFRPTTPKFNKPFKVLITNAGKWGWKSDIYGYGYTPIHPITNKLWPKIPESILEIWKDYCKDYPLPNSCLINLYNYPDSTLGVHQDKDERNFNNPVLSISLGSSAIFVYGKKKTKMKKICLSSGSIVLMDGNSRLDYHGIRKIIKDEKNILNQKKNFGFPRNSRINITLRVYESKNY